jgi:ABC-2 type transport system ATP-binding protein
MANAAISVESLAKRYPRTLAVDGVSFEIKPGEIFGLLGPNGAGKTTVIRTLLTLIKPTAGKIRIFGVDALSHPDDVRALAGYVPQDVSVDGELTGYENMLMFARLYDVPGKKRESLIQEALLYLNLADRQKDLVATYSGGMMRRLEIAQTLVNRPRVLYLDEPSIGLDPNARKTIWEHVEQLRQEFGTTILITTHDMNEADALCHRVGIMNKGKLVALDQPDRLKDTLGGDIVSIEPSSSASKLAELGYTLMPRSDGPAQIIVADGERQIPQILERLKGSGVAVESVSLKKPTLDDVFLKYTGARMDQGQGDSFLDATRTRRTIRRLG